jgi:hypothetical protein
VCVCVHAAGRACSTNKNYPEPVDIRGRILQNIVIVVLLLDR